MTELEEVAIRATFGAAALYGWQVSNLNDNPHGVVVRGENWKAERADGKTLYAWTSFGLASLLEVWMSMTDEEPQDSP